MIAYRDHVNKVLDLQVPDEYFLLKFIVGSIRSLWSLFLFHVSSEAILKLVLRNFVFVSTADGSWASNFGKH